jgi:hypothetical protein
LVVSSANAAVSATGGASGIGVLQAGGATALDGLAGRRSAAGARVVDLLLHLAEGLPRACREVFLDLAADFALGELRTAGHGSVAAE